MKVARLHKVLRRKPCWRPAGGGRELDFDVIAQHGIELAGLRSAAQNVGTAGDMHSALTRNRGLGQNYCAAFGDFFEVAGDRFGGAGAIDADEGH